jgi:hypothetical protein
LARTSVCCSGDNVHGGAALRRIDSKLFWEEGEAHLDVGEPKFKKNDGHGNRVMGREEVGLVCADYISFSEVPV